MATTVVTNKIYKASSSKEVDVKPKVTNPAPAAAGAAVLTPASTPTTIQAAAPVKATNAVYKQGVPAVAGKAKY